MRLRSTDNTTMSTMSQILQMRLVKILLDKVYVLVVSKTDIIIFVSPKLRESDSILTFLF